MGGWAIPRWALRRGETTQPGPPLADARYTGNMKLAFINVTSLALTSGLLVDLKSHVVGFAEHRLSEAAIKAYKADYWRTRQYFVASPSETAVGGTVHSGVGVVGAPGVPIGEVPPGYLPVQGVACGW